MVVVPPFYPHLPPRTSTHNFIMPRQSIFHPSLWSEPCCLHHPRCHDACAKFWLSRLLSPNLWATGNARSHPSLCWEPRIAGQSKTPSLSLASPTCCSKFTSNVTPLGVDKSAGGSQREDPFSVLQEKLRQEPLLTQAPPNLSDVRPLSPGPKPWWEIKTQIPSFLLFCHSLPPPDKDNSAGLDPMKEAAHRMRVKGHYPGVPFFCKSLQGKDTVLPQRKRCPYLGPNVFPFLSWTCWGGLHVWALESIAFGIPDSL